MVITSPFLGCETTHMVHLGLTIKCHHHRSQSYRNHHPLLECLIQWVSCSSVYFNPLSPKIHIQILQTDLHTFLLGIVEKSWFKIKALFFPVVINLVILITFTLNDLLMLFGEN